jgi:hypothetical protein
MELAGLEPATSWVRSRLLNVPVLQGDWRVNGSAGCHKSRAICGSFREFWHVVASEWQNSPRNPHTPRHGPWLVGGYGALPEHAERFLAGACPIVASDGGRHRSLRGTAQDLERMLSANDIAHDVKEHADAGHGFLNDHAPGEVPKLFVAMARSARTGHHEPSAQDARRRIVAFFDAHLTSP